MRAVCVEAPDVIQLKEVTPKADLGPDEVRVAVSHVGVCGSDVALIRGQNPFARFPVIPGHEISGVLSEVGKSAAGRFKAGTPVAVMPVWSCGECEFCLAGEVNHCSRLRLLGVHVDGGYAEEVVVKESMVRRLPPGVSLQQGAAVEPLAVAIHCANRVRIDTGDSVAVLGSGVIGLLLIQVARLYGAAKIAAIDIVDARLEIARELGADVTANPSRGDPVPRCLKVAALGFRVVFDMVGTDESLRQAMALTRSGGSIVPLVPPKKSVLEYPFLESFGREISLVTSRLYGLQDFDMALSLLGERRIKVDRIITQAYKLEDIGDALATLKSRPDIAIKVMLNPQPLEQLENNWLQSARISRIVQ
ncbi:MAG TPA: alcohol dehydrogenase catalytic domain-containing protein [Firmicutes bacterium]|nr:alcohol dehydrogenase catalytic domain-containing protein [Bacillota bacterium]